MTCVHGRLDGAFCPHCLSAAPVTACLDCAQVTGGRCPRHSVTTVSVGTITLVNPIVIPIRDD